MRNVGGLGFRQNSVNADALLINFFMPEGQVCIGYSYDYTISEFPTPAAVRTKSPWHINSHVG